MADISRRAFLTRGSMGLAVAGVAASTPMLPALLGAVEAEAPAAESSTAELPEGAVLTEAIVARVRDLATGEIDLFSGDRLVTLRDPSLAARLFKASR